MTVFEWIVVIGLGVAVWQLIAINIRIGVIGHVVLNIEEELKRTGVELIRQRLPEQLEKRIFGRGT